MNLPTLVTFLRVALIPFIIVFALYDSTWFRIVAASIFCLAALTDWLDGYLARKLEQTTAFGAFLDPLADKLLVVSILIILTTRYDSLWLTLPVIVITAREIIISGLREWMSRKQRLQSVLTNALGKRKTFLQLIAIILLLLGSTADPNHYFAFTIAQIGYVALYLALALTLWSMFRYLMLGYSDFIGHIEKSQPTEKKIDR